MHEELKAIRESLNLELIREEKHQLVTVKGKGVSASYYEVNKPGSKLIKRCFAEIDGYNFELQVTVVKDHTGRKTVEVV